MSYGTAVSDSPARAKTARYLAVAKSGHESLRRPTFSSIPNSVCWTSTLAFFTAGSTACERVRVFSTRSR
jgi:hypothetical protein